MNPDEFQQRLTRAVRESVRITVCCVCSTCSLIYRVSDDDRCPVCGEVGAYIGSLRLYKGREKATAEERSAATLAGDNDALRQALHEVETILLPAEQTNDLSASGKRVMVIVRSALRIGGQ